MTVRHTSLVIIFMLVAIGLIACSSDQTENRQEQQIPQQEQQVQQQVRQERQQQQMQNQQADTSEIQVPERELRQFVNGMHQIQAIDQKVQQEMLNVLEEIGLDPERYQELSRMQQAPDESAGMTEQERGQFRQAQERIQEIQRDATQQQQEAIQNAGLDLQRFQELSSTIRQNPDLMAKYQDLMQEIE